MTFYGVRGSCPCSGESIRRYGGATSCVAVAGDEPGALPIILDLGTGCRRLGEDLAAGRVIGRATAGSEPLALTAVTTHLHFDHVQGLPFFRPALLPDTQLDIYGPPSPEGTLEEMFAGFVRPPYFPVPLDQLPAKIRFHEAVDGEIEVADSARLVIRTLPHVGLTCGYRVEIGGASVAFVSDHQAPHELDRVADSVLELCDGADLLIHDAQYTDDEFRQKEEWGHSTVGYAVLVAREAGVRRLALYHHDPTHDDEQLDAFGELAAALAEGSGMDQVVVASEGMELRIPGHTTGAM